MGFDAHDPSGVDGRIAGQEVRKDPRFCSRELVIEALDDFAQYYDWDTFQAFRVLSARPGWTERIASVRETCRLRDRRSYPVLVDAIRSHFEGRSPELSWLAAP